MNDGKVFCIWATKDHVRRSYQLSKLGCVHPVDDAFYTRLVVVPVNLAVAAELDRGVLCPITTIGQLDSLHCVPGIYAIRAIDLHQEAILVGAPAPPLPGSRASCQTRVRQSKASNSGGLAHSPSHPTRAIALIAASAATNDASMPQIQALARSRAVRPSDLAGERTRPQRRRRGYCVLLTRAASARVARSQTRQSAETGASSRRDVPSQERSVALQRPHKYNEPRPLLFEDRGSFFLHMVETAGIEPASATACWRLLRA